MTSEKRTYTRRTLLASVATGVVAGCQAPSPPAAETTSRRSETTADDDGTPSEQRQFDPSGAFWPMEGYDAGNTKHAPGVVPTPDERWRVRGAIEQGDVLGTPAVADGVLFIGNGYRMLGLDVSGGSIRWDRTLDLQVAFHSPAICDDTVLVPGVSVEGGTNGLYAFDAGDGTTNWRAEIPITSSPVVVEDAAYVSVDGSDGKALSARSIEDGTERLAVEFEPVDGGARFAPKPAVVDGTIYLPVRGVDEEGTSTMVALDAADGRERWRRPLASEVHGAPAVADGRAYVGTTGGAVVALDGTSGEVVWTADSVGAIRQPPCVADETLYVVDVDGTVRALGTSDGRERWAVGTTHPHQSRPVVGDGTVVLSGSTILALDATDGRHRWEFDLSNMASTGFTPAALLDGALVVASCTKSDSSQRMYDNNVHLLG